MAPSKDKGFFTRRDFVKATGAAAGAVAAANILPSKADAAGKDRIITAHSQEPVQYNPLLYVNRGTENGPEAAMFDALWDMNEKGQFVANLATEVPSRENGRVSEDGRVWKIGLKRDVRWHDGQPFTAKDVAFTYETIMDSKTAVRSRSGFDLIKNFKTVDDYNVEIELAEPYTPFLWSWQEMHIVPRHILKDEPDINTSAFNSEPTGTGPFRYKSRTAGSHIVFERFDDYHRGAAKVKTLIQKTVPDTMVLYGQVKTGEVDYMMTSLPYDRWDEAAALPDRTFFDLPLPWVQFIYFNCGKPQFSDPKVRKALYMALEMQKSLDDIYLGRWKRTFSYLHTSHWAYNPSLKEETPNPQLAAKMLEEAGWKVGADGIREKDGHKMKFTMSTTAGNTARQGCQALFQQNWKAIGVEMEIKNMPGSVVWGEYTTKSQFDTLLVAWAPIVGMDPDYTARCHSKFIPAKYGQGSNYVQYENTEVDRLLEKGAVQVDRQGRKETYMEVQKILLDEVPFAPQGGVFGGFVRNKNLMGLKPNQYVTDSTWNIQDWYWG
ncbi:MAG: peptide ABC transporter substrate-binding protein [Alphaproteobacteria bacterium]|nr:peptide ABC transporter substrate-binding protein [Alphaproteobacteria bacterium]